MAYIRGSPREEPRSSEDLLGGGGGTEADDALARRLQAEEQGRPVARFKRMDRVEARYRTRTSAAARGRGSTTSRPSSTCSHRRRRSGRTST